MRKLQVFFIIFALCLAACAPAGETTVEEQIVQESELNIDVWLERLEVGSRELYSARDAVVAAIGIEEGQWIADIGAGTGLYSLLFAEKVGSTGRVFAEDIEPLFLDLIRQRAIDADLTNITVVLGHEDDITLPDQTIDIMFIADTYHYFSDREKVMRSIFKSLKPGGRLVMIEYNLKSASERAEHRSHVRFGKEAVISEVEFVGFKFVEEVAVTGLVDSYFVTFEKAQ